MTTAEELRSILVERLVLVANPPELRDYWPDLAAFYAAYDAHDAAADLLLRRAENLRATI